jgi:hypothetical protein
MQVSQHEHSQAASQAYPSHPFNKRPRMGRTGLGNAQVRPWMDYSYRIKPSLKESTRNWIKSIQTLLANCIVSLWMDMIPRSRGHLRCPKSLHLPISTWLWQERWFQTTSNKQLPRCFSISSITLVIDEALRARRPRPYSLEAILKMWNVCSSVINIKMGCPKWWKIAKGEL